MKHDEQPIVPHPVRIVAYDPAWPARAAEIVAMLRGILGEELIVVEHIGSTSVPGLAAKPVIDLLPVVRNIGTLEGERSAIEAMGYAWRGEFGIEGRRFCPLSSPTGERLVHLHFFQQGAAHIRRHLAFRDYLRQHPAVAQEYEREKRRSAAIWPEDSLAYNDEKAAWVRQHERAALEWYAIKSRIDP